MTPRLVTIDGGPYPLALLGEIKQDFGIPVADLIRPPGRFWTGVADPPHAYHPSVDRYAFRDQPSPGERVAGTAPGEPALAFGRRSIAKLRAWFLLLEDPQRRLDVRAVETLAHQMSLVQYVLRTSGLQRVLIADEVGLGKTVEAGLIVEALLLADPGLRVLYLAPARLVNNVAAEFARLGLEGFRRFAVGGNGTFDDPRLIASIHRAAHPAHMDRATRGPAWDILIVDECHHLSDWAEGGGAAGEQYRLVDRLQRRMSPEGRVILLSGTPHQGHDARFENLLSLLRHPSEATTALAGRVVFRTKEDVRDWEGRPLFPKRDVRTPTVVALGDDHARWLREIRAFFDNASGRAGGWRCSQALQWATSSVQAGLGYLVRQAVRAGWDLGEPALSAALSAIRPYRGGPPTEEASSVLARIRRDVGYGRQEWDEDEAPEDQEEEPPERWRPDPIRLRALLHAGVDLLAGPAASAKWELVAERILAHAKDEKVVFFAQPIETVYAFLGWLRAHRGEDAALIVGGQSEADRDEQIRRFLAPHGARFLVSSRAGGEGINLQISRWLVHLDVPWNPMDMEQRVGRVHRFGSRRTIRVDTVVTEGSPEARTYDVARIKLQNIASAMGDAQGFEALFSRVMSLIPPQEMQQILLTSSPQFQPDQEQVARVVRNGFDQWRTFHARFAATAKAIADVDAGAATWKHVADLIRERLRAEPFEGVRSTRFQEGEDEHLGEDIEVPAWRLDDGRVVTCGPVPGLPPETPDGKRATPIGLNDPGLAALIRDEGLAVDAGAAWLLLKDRPVWMEADVIGVLVLARQLVTLDPARPFGEHSAILSVWLVGPAFSRELDRAQGSDLIVRLLAASPRAKADGEFRERVAAVEMEAVARLGAPTAAERQARLRPAVHPVFAAMVQ